MSAEDLLSSALGMIDDVINQQVWLFPWTTNDLKRVQGMLVSIRALLADVERIVDEEESVGLWLSRLRSVAYDIENVVGDWLLKNDGNENVSGNDDNRRNKLCECLSALYHLFYHHVVSQYKLGVNLKEIMKRLDQIDKEKNQFDFSWISSSDRERWVSRRSQTTISLMNKEIIGRDDDIRNVVGWLIRGSSNDKNVEVIGIVGIGGIGKTTLAQKIYNHPQVQNHFQGNLHWVSVSDTFDWKRHTKAIIEVKGATSFLLVLDDIWNTDEGWWETLQPCLASGASGSRILVTTRSVKVANILNATYIYELQLLSDYSSWSLFRNIAFEGRSEAECSELESVGKQMVKRCHGVPLFVMVMASMMNLKSFVTDWEKVLGNKRWSLPEDEKVFPALLLSYENLPSELRQCFVYCSIFPKNWKLDKEKLVKLWVAQGFIRPDENTDLDYIAAEYFNDLVALSIFQQGEVDYQGQCTYKIHDILHDLAKFNAKDEIYTSDRNGRKLEQGPSDSVAQHAFLSFNANDGNPSDNGSHSDNNPSRIAIPPHIAKNLRTLILDRVVEETDMIDVFHTAKQLRAVILKIERLPEEIGELKQLRYMDLSGTPIVELPESVSYLSNLMCMDLSSTQIVKLPESVTYLPNLRTLDLSFCLELKQLPIGIGRMLSLRFLKIKGTDSLQSLPKGLGYINGLRSLSKFIVGGEGGSEIEELQWLNSLQGSLEIEHLERVSSREEAEKAKLWNKLHLRRLVLRVSEEGEDDDAKSKRIYSVLEGLRPQNLEELEVYGYSGWNLPSWMDEPDGLMLPRSLEKLGIYECNKLKSLSEGLGKFKKLKSLRISDCEKLTHLPDSIKELELLENFQILYCGKLESLPDGLGRLKKLKSLQISFCKKLTCLPDSLGQLEVLESLTIEKCCSFLSLPDSMSQLKALKYLEILSCPLLLERCRRGGEDWPKISHIPNITPSV